MSSPVSRGLRGLRRTAAGQEGRLPPGQYLTEELRVGDELELRGPIGGYFVWEPGDGSPLILLAGGPGIVPLRSIVRHRSRTGSDVPTRLLYSSRTLPDVIYRAELEQYHNGVKVSYTLIRAQPPGWTGYMGRIDAALLAQVAWRPRRIRWPLPAGRRTSWKP